MTSTSIETGSEDPIMVEDTVDLESQHSSTQVPQEQAEGQDAQEGTSSGEPNRANCYKKSAVALILLSIVAFVIADSLTTGYVGDGVTSFLEWVEDKPSCGILVFIVIYFVATILFVPGSILTLGAGFVFANAFGLGAGVLLGTLVVFLGASAGAIASFFLGRFLLRDWAIGLAKKYSIFEAIDKTMAEKGFRIMVLLRLSPIIPFNAINYIAGVTSITFWQYFWALFAILPGTVLYVFLGASAGSLSDSADGNENTTLTIVIVVVGVFFGFLAVALTSSYAKKELNQLAEQRQEDATEEDKVEQTEDMGGSAEGDDSDSTSPSEVHRSPYQGQFVCDEQE